MKNKIRFFKTTGETVMKIKNQISMKCHDFRKLSRDKILANIKRGIGEFSLHNH